MAFISIAAEKCVISARLANTELKGRSREMRE